jgi:hypothetical protein
MELRPGEVVPPDDRGQRATVIGNGDEIGGIRKAEVITVYEIGMSAGA